VRVYRVEAPGNNKGAYAHPFAYAYPFEYMGEDADWSWYDRMCRKHMGSDHPDPYEDGMDYATSWDYRFGFPSMQHLFRWFGGWLQHLLDAGQKVSVYEVEERFVATGKSGRQVAFNLERATRIK